MTKDYNCDTISRQAVEGDDSLIEHPEIFSDMEWLNKHSCKWSPFLYIGEILQRVWDF